MDETLRELIEIIHFTENVSAKLHGLLEEAEIYKAVKEEFAQSGRYTASILLLTDDGSKLGIAETSIAPEKLRAGEKAAGVRLKGYKIDLSKSSIFGRVIMKRETVRVSVGDIVDELLPRPLAYLVSKTMGYEQKPCVLTPLKRQGKIVGSLGVSSPALADYFVPSVRNLAQHISTALELAYEHAERTRAGEELRKHRDQLEELVEERTAELMRANEQLQKGIAERNRAEETLRRSESKFRNLFEHTTDAIFLADAQTGVIIDANPASCRMLGLPKEKIVGMHQSQLHPPEEVERYTDIFREHAEKGIAITEDLFVQRPDGKRVPVDISANVVELAGKSVVQGSFRDITERRRAEEALRHRAAQLATVGEIGRQIASVLDLGELLRQIVGLLEEAFGYRYVYLLLLDENSRELVARAGAGAGKIVEGTRIPLEARSINAHVARTGKPLLVKDVSKEPMYLVLEETADTKSELCVPIKVKGQVIGTLDVQSMELDAFDESDLSTLQILAHQAAIAIENAQLYEEAQRRIAELTGLHELSQAFSSVTDVRETYGELTKRMAQLIGCQACTIATYDQITREMRAQPPGYGAPDKLVQSFHYEVDGPARAAWNFRLQGPLLANDITQIPGLFSQWVEGFGLSNLLIVPMTLEGRITGLVYAANKPGGFTEGDSKLLTIFAGQAAVIIENARLYEESRHRLDELSTIHEVSVAATSTMDLDQALERAVAAMQRVLDFQVFGFLLLDENTGELRLHPSYRGIDPETAGKLDLRLGKGITGWVAETGQPLLVPDVRQDPHYLDAVAGIRSEMCVPLKIGERVIGVIDVESDQVNAFSEDDLRLLSTLAGQVATTVENARLFAETGTKANDLSLLLDTSAAISSTLDLDQILETVAQQITASLVVTFCRITLLDETGVNLVIRAVYPIREEEEVNDLSHACPLLEVPWHKWVIETGKPVILRQDVPELAVSDEERRLLLAAGVQSAALIPLIVGGRVLGIISLGEERAWERSPFTLEKVRLCQSIARQAAVAIENARLYEELRQSFMRVQRTLEGTVNVLVSAIEMRDRYTAGHQRRVIQLACAIARKMGLPEEQIEGLRMAGLVHDIGKITVPAEILSKPARLNDIEYGLIKAHPEIGYDLLKTIDFPWPVAQIVLQHHERLDGSGYPQGLVGEEIMLEARILAVADVVEAIASFRPYRPALGTDNALEEISQNRGVLYDPEVVDVCLKLFADNGFELE